MTREEAIKVIKVLFDNPLFSDLHRAAFNIAIHDIKARHDWDINNLILINKDNYEPLEQEPILDKIRAEIDEVYEELDGCDPDSLGTFACRIDDILDKYKAESEPQESEG